MAITQFCDLRCQVAFFVGYIRFSMRPPKKNALPSISSKLSGCQECGASG